MGSRTVGFWLLRWKPSWEARDDRWQGLPRSKPAGSFQPCRVAPGFMRSMQGCQRQPCNNPSEPSATTPRSAGRTLRTLRRDSESKTAHEVAEKEGHAEVAALLRD